MNIQSLSYKDLINIPDRENWDTPTAYDSLLIFSSKKKHDSGWSQITIVGVIAGNAKEKATTHSDDLNWLIEPNQYGECSMRTDCIYKSKAFHFWSNYHKFEVGMSLSSIDIKVKKYDKR